MKRVKAACICQALHFTLKEDAPMTGPLSRFRRKWRITSVAWNATVHSIKS